MEQTQDYKDMVNKSIMHNGACDNAQAQLTMVLQIYLPSERQI